MTHLFFFDEPQYPEWWVEMVQNPCEWLTFMKGSGLLGYVTLRQIDWTGHEGCIITEDGTELQIPDVRKIPIVLLSPEQSSPHIYGQAFPLWFQPFITINGNSYRDLKKEGLMDYIFWHEIGHLVSIDADEIEKNAYQRELEADKYAFDVLGEDMLTRFLDYELTPVLQSSLSIDSASDFIKARIFLFAEIGIRKAQDIIEKMGWNRDQYARNESFE